MAVGCLCENDADAAAAWLVAAEARTAFARRARVDEDPRTFDRAGRIDARVRLRSNLERRALERVRLGCRAVDVIYRRGEGHFTDARKEN